MNKATWFFVGTLAFGLTACGSSTSPSIGAGPGLGEEFTLAVGQSIEVIPGLVVAFREVLGDSRCPSDALILCIWEGDATAAVRVVAGTEAPGDLELHTNDQFERAGSYGAFTIRLVELAPYPATTDPIPSEDYRLRLTVTRR